MLKKFQQVDKNYAVIFFIIHHLKYRIYQFFKKKRSFQYL